MPQKKASLPPPEKKNVSDTFLRQAWRFSLCSSGSFTGCRQWLRVPFYPSAWKAGWAKVSLMGDSWVVRIVMDDHFVMDYHHVPGS